MNSLLRWLVTLMALCSVAARPALAGPPSPTLKLQRGVNLEGWLDQAPFAGFDPGQLRALPVIRAAGFDFVRLLVSPVSLIGARLGDTALQDALARVLTAARQNNLRVLITLYDEEPSKAQMIGGGKALDTYLVMLERLGHWLAPYDARWVGLEPVDQPAACALSPVAWAGREAQLVAAVRRRAPALTLLVTSPCFSNYYSLSLLLPLADPNLIYSFQYVEPIVFTQQGNTEQPTWQYFKHVPYPYTAAQLRSALAALLGDIPDAGLRAQVQKEFQVFGGERFDGATIRGQLAVVANWARRNAVSVLLNAFTVRRSAPGADRLRWFTDVRQAAEAGSFAWAAWSWTSPHGFSLSENGQLPRPLGKALGLR